MFQNLSIDDETLFSTILKQIDSKLLCIGTGNPNSIQKGQSIGQLYLNLLDTSLWVCTTTGDESSSVWAPVFSGNTAGSTTAMSSETLDSRYSYAVPTIQATRDPLPTDDGRLDGLIFQADFTGLPTVKDISGNNLFVQGVDLSPVSINRPYGINYGATFNGLSSFIPMRDDVTANSIKARTISLSFTTNSKNDQVIYKEGTSSEGLSISIEGGNLYFGIYKNNTKCFINLTININTLYDIDFCWDGSLVKAYVNKNIIDSNNFVNTLQLKSRGLLGHTDGDVQLYSGPVNTGHFFSGNIYYFRVFNTSLTSKEIIKYSGIPFIGSYLLGSTWINTSVKKMYICTDNTPTNAVWKDVTLAKGDLGNLALQNADNVQITGGIIADSAIGQRTIQDSIAPNGDTNSVGTLLSWLSNRIKAVTGKQNWKTNPSINLEQVSGHVNDIENPHKVTPEQINAIKMPATINNTGLIGVSSGGQSLSTNITINPDGNLNANSTVISNLVLNTSSEKLSKYLAGGILNIKMEDGQFIVVNPNSKLVINLPNLTFSTTSAYTLTVFIKQSNVYFDVIFNSVSWADGVQPQVPTDPNKGSLYQFFWVENTWFGQLVNSGFNLASQS
jgi:hypothetical protein